MTRNKTMTSSASFAVSKLGQWTTARFTELLAPLGLRPRHCAVLEMLRAGPCGQLALARKLRVNPSVVVDMVDELEHRNAVRRVRDDNDRRRQIVELTEEGRALADRCLTISHDLDKELLAGLDSTARADFTRTVRLLIATHGIPPPAE
jgi:DNA-binding MarR family transcriptional regulator